MRRFLFWPLAVFAVALLAPMTFAPPAFALSIDRDTGMNSDGTPKFADPDDQMPGFMTPPAGAPSSPQATPSVLLPMSPSENTGVFIDGVTGQQAPDAFEQDYNRK